MQDNLYTAFMNYGTQEDKRKASILQNNGQPSLGKHIAVLDSWGNYRRIVEGRKQASQAVVDYLLDPKRKTAQEKDEMSLLKAAHSATSDKRLGAVIMSTDALELAGQQAQEQKPEQNIQGGKN
jgi:hypothetical protein